MIGCLRFQAKLNVSRAEVLKMFGHGLRKPNLLIAFDLRTESAHVFSPQSLRCQPDQQGCLCRRYLVVEIVFHKNTTQNLSLKFKQTKAPFELGL